MNDCTHPDGASCHSSEPCPPADPGAENTKGNILKRLARIEGQVKGIARMVEERRYCIDIVNQITAAQAALNGVTDLVLRKHLETCVTNAMTGDDPADRRAKIDELMKLYARARTL